MQQKIFGKNPDGERLERISKSPHYIDGSFKNIYPTEVMLPEASMIEIMFRQFNKPDGNIPEKALPSVKTDLRTLDDDFPVVVWFGHSSYLVKYRGKNILVDPVFSKNASPVRFFGNSFPGTDIFNAEDFDKVDMVVITHDHYDHLDFRTIEKLNTKTGLFITALGIGSHLTYWGIPENKIIEMDWWEQNKIDNEIEFIATPARHFSGRAFRRYKTQWSSFILKWNGYNIFLGGDSGYDDTFQKIGEKFGPFDLAILEAGQYGEHWPLIHMMPEETVQASIDLNAKVLLPVHWGRFSLAFHKWNEPVERVVKSAAENNVNVTTPKIGEPVILGGNLPNEEWWDF